MVCKSVGGGAFEVVSEVMDMHVAIAKAFSRGNVEVSDNFVYTKGTFDAASL